MRRPNLFILGAPRCGTSALFEFLGAHPDVHPCQIKEPRYFIPAGDRSLDEYVRLFAGATDEPWLLEATPGYLSTPDAPRQIREFSPQARAIVMVRNPIEQLRSLHRLRVFLRREHSLDLAAELSMNDAQDIYWKRVRSGENLARVLEVFPRQDVHVIVHDDFRADNASEYRRVLEFLAIDDSFAPRFRTINPSSEPRSQALQRVLWRDGGVVRAIGRTIVPEQLRKAAFDSAATFNRRRLPDSEIDPELASALWRSLEPDVELLGSLLDRDLVGLWGR